MTPELKKKKTTYHLVINLCCNKTPYILLRGGIRARDLEAELKVNLEAADLEVDLNPELEFDLEVVILEVDLETDLGVGIRGQFGGQFRG